jgi:glycosyltransferase involved in cell wall biosynthesis
MKIIHVAKVAGIAGSEGHLIQLLPRLRAAGIDARMIVLGAAGHKPGDLIEALRAQGVPADLMPVAWHIDPGLILRLRDHFRAERPDIVHTHLIHADLHASPAARSAGVPHVVGTRHNTDRFRAWLPFRAINRWLWAQTDRGIAISDAVRKFIYQYEGARPGQVQTIYYGFEPPPDDPGDAARQADLRRELAIPPEAPLIGSICRLIEQKGLSYALQAFAQVLQRAPNAHYLIAGDGRLRGELERQVQALGLADRVHFLGWRSDTHAIYEAMDVFLAPSLWEGFGLVLLEAMGHSLPVIGSTAGAIPEIVIDGETGLLAPPADAAALVEPLARLLTDREAARRMGQAGRKRLETTFSVERMVGETIRFYEGVIG